MAHSVPAAPAAPPPGRRYTLLPLTLLAKGRITRGAVLRIMVIMLLFLVMGAVLIITTTLLERMSQDVHRNSMALNLAHELEITVLAHRRNSLLFLAYNDSAYLVANNQLLVQADQLIPALAAASVPTKASAQDVLGDYAQFRAALVVSPVRPTPALQRTIDRLINALEQYRQANMTRMNETRRASEELNRTIDVVVVTTVPLFALLLLLNAYQFWKQVFDPLAQLDAVTQRLARGEMDARVTVTRQDELGALADTFNTMADALAAREMERQHALAAVAHDLRGPLTIISGLNELLPMSTPAQHKEYHARIAAQCRRLEGMTRDLMETVRIESGKLTVARDQVDVAQVVRETVADLCELHRDREITLAGPDRCPVVGDALRLARVISNLLTNALKYSQPEMPVAVTLTRTATHVRVAIADQGQGMTDDEIKQLFQPFSRLSRTAHSRAGTGLGLYSVHRIVEAHGGRVWLESVPGSGTTAMVELPLA